MDIAPKPGTTAYVLLHQIISSTRGKADIFICVDCDDCADEWSHSHGLDAYNINNYDPRCLSCHRTYDHPQKGELNNGATLSEQDVVEIRNLYAAGGISQQKLADMYGVTQSNIGYIVRRESWAHVH